MYLPYFCLLPFSFCLDYGASVTLAIKSVILIESDGGRGWSLLRAAGFSSMSVVTAIKPHHTAAAAGAIPDLSYFRQKYP